MKAITPTFKKIEASSFCKLFLFTRNFFTPFVLLLSCVLAMSSGASAQNETYTYYLDSDGDGYGQTDSFITSANPDPPAGYAALDGDCDDNNAAVHPGATEIIGNGIDDNCNGQVDEGGSCFAYLDN